MMIRHVLQGSEEDHRFFKSFLLIFSNFAQIDIYILYICIFKCFSIERLYIYISENCKISARFMTGGKSSAIRFFTNSVHLLPEDPALSMQLKSNNGLGK